MPYAADSIWVNSTTAGTADFTLGTAIAGYRTFATAGVPNSSIIHYSARTATEFENGEGAYNSGTNVLARTTIFASSNTNAKVNFGSNPTVAVTPLAEDVIFPPVSSTDNAVVRWDGALGDAAQNSNVTINDAGDLAVPSSTASTSSTTGALVVTGGVGVGGAITSGGEIRSSSAASGQNFYGFGSVSGQVAGFYINSFNVVGFQLQVTDSAGGYSIIGTSTNHDVSLIRNAAPRFSIHASNTAFRGGAVFGYEDGGDATGGAVTQLTSRTTAVTLNKACGVITLFSVAGSATFQSFTINNSLVLANDAVIVVQKSGTDLYEIHVTAVAAGSFRLTFRTTGGTTNEAPAFTFAIIRSSAI
jgi:hypothetical protein